MKKNNYFKYIVIAAVILIPFMYSFFYLKAYWDPYGKGNIDNIPVAIVNEDDGDKGEEIIDSIKKAKKLKLVSTTNKKATDGLYNNEYYAVITVPSDFTDSLNSASEENKRHATITYSPNQKSNYLASQIINNVVLNVEKNLDNTVNSTIVDNLANKVKEVPDSLDTISNGFNDLHDGTSKLKDGTDTLSSGAEAISQGTGSLVSGSNALVSGSNTLVIGVNSLDSNYDLFNDGLFNLKSGTDKLAQATSNLGSLNSSLTDLVGGVSDLKNGSDQLLGMNDYVDGTNKILSTVDYASTLCAAPETENEQKLCAIITGIQSSPDTQKLKASGTVLKAGNQKLNAGLTELNNKVSGLSSVSGQITELQNGITELQMGANTLYNSSLQISNGIKSLKSGASTLNNGINTLGSGINTLDSGAKTLSSGALTLKNGMTTLDNSVLDAKKELDTNIDNTKKEVKKVDGLSDYSKEAVNLKTDVVDEISSYGTAFSPFFISIALWVGCLMMYIVLYYDKDERFGIFGINNNNRLKRTLAYHALATVSAITLGILLNCLLDFKITSMPLYFVSLILIANMFIAIIGFLIENFGDIGKFIALILLVLQLAAAGGTFPIETVTKGFRWMNNYLPMKYTIALLRESLVVIEKNLLTKNIIVIIVLLVVFTVINISSNLYKEKKANK